MHYQVRYKNRPWGEAITAGFRARVARPGEAHLGHGYTHIIAGLQFGALETLKAVRNAGEPYLFVDRAYFGGGHKSGRMRITFGAYQQHWIAARRPPRGWGVALEPWRDGGDFVMVVPPSPQVESLFGFNWERDYMQDAQETFPRITISPKSDRDVSPLSERLKGCRAVLTWSSNVAVEAICAGVPAFVSEHSAAAPVAGRLNAALLHGAHEPPRPERADWFHSLCNGQFSLEEVASGFARDVVMPEMELAHV